MNLVEEINQELSRGFTKSELERIWDLPKNSLSAILNPENKAKLSKKAEIRVKAYFEQDPSIRPNPSPKIAKNKFKPTQNDKVEAENRSNPLTNAARGRDKSGVNEDEVKVPKKKIPESDSEAPTSLSDIFKNRNINDRTYKHPKS